LYGLSFGSAQELKYSTYYHHKITLFELLPNLKNEIIFLGNSITDGGEWSEFLQNDRVINRGISGDVTEGILYRLNEITESKPLQVFLMIGTNDLALGSTKEITFNNICKIVNEIRNQSPKTEVIVQSIFPVNSIYEKFSGHTRNTEKIKWINRELSAWCSKNDIVFVDIFQVLKNENDDLLNPDYTYDGLHLNGKGYQVWVNKIRPYVK